MKAKEIYDILRAGGLTRAGALGILGNMAAESTAALDQMLPQFGMTHMTPEEYTKAADEGRIDFVHDGVGYGLCQWTFWSRKQGLLEYAKEMGVSVGDGVMQCYYVLKELREEPQFISVYHTLCSSTDIDECADLVCKKYEQPAVNNYSTRRENAHRLEKEITEQTYTPPVKDPVSATFPPDPSVMILQMVMQYNGYWGEITGYKSAEFFRKLREFTDDMEKC